MPHILFVTQYYPPEVGADQTHIGETASRLVKLGHRVTVLTTLPNYPLGIVPPEYRHGARRRETLDGVSVVRVWSYIAPHKGFLRRILAQLSFGCLAPFLGAKAVGRPDVIIVLSPPLFTAIAGRLLAWQKHCPFIFHVADIWPEAAVQLGVLHNRLLIWFAEWLERSTYRRSAAIWTISEGCRRILIERGVSPEKVFVVRIGADTTLLRPLPKRQARTQLGWNDRFVLLYAGTLGLAQGLQTVLHAAEELRSNTDIRFVFVGDGAAKADLLALAQQRGLTNVTFLGLQPRERIPLLIAAADACLVPLRKLSLFEATLPVKMYEAMACARPIVLAADGESRQLAKQEAGAAIAVEPENATALAQAVLSLHDHPDCAEQLGQRGRAFIETFLSRDVLAAALEARITALLAEK
jgi:colanic acid biosynthesis glycosyl transferase WcaI